MFFQFFGEKTKKKIFCFFPFCLVFVPRSGKSKAKSLFLPCFCLVFASFFLHINFPHKLSQSVSFDNLLTTCPQICSSSLAPTNLWQAARFSIIKQTRHLDGGPQKRACQRDPQQKEGKRANKSTPSNLFQSVNKFSGCQQHHHQFASMPGDNQ